MFKFSCNFYVQETNGHWPSPVQQIPITSLYFKCIELRQWRDSSLYLKECLLCNLPMSNLANTDDSALTRSLKVHRLLCIYDVNLWKQYAVKKWLYYIWDAVLSSDNPR